MAQPRGGTDGTQEATAIERVGADTLIAVSLGVTAQSSDAYPDHVITGKPIQHRSSGSKPLAAPVCAAKEVI
jgi:hypothetical protein